MKKVILATIIFASFSLVATIALKPEKLQTTHGTWQRKTGKFQGEQFRDIAYDGKVIFRILERFLPIFEALLLDATNKKSNIIYNDDNVTFWDSAEQIKQHLSVSPTTAFILTEHPDNIILAQEGTFIKDYFINFKCNPKKYHPISHIVFEQMSILKTIAIVQKVHIEIDVNALLKAKTFADFSSACALVEEPISNDYLCTICLTKAKNTIFWPCRHLCVCDECGKNIQDFCPICRSHFASKERVYM